MLDTENLNQVIPDTNTVEKDTSWSTFNKNRLNFNTEGEENSKSIKNNGLGNGVDTAAGKSGIKGQHIGIEKNK